jgi:hypothetical protein
MKITATVLITSLTAWLDRYGWLAFGLAGGMLAKYALRVKRHRPIHLSLVLADIALLPVVALIAFSLAERIGAAAEAAVAKLCPVTTQNQFDALVSFAYNLGEGNLSSSTLRKLHNAGNHAGAKAEFGKWINAGGKPLAGLAKRRAVEAALYGASA